MPVMTVFQERMPSCPRRGRPTLYESGEGKRAPLIGVRLPPDELAAVDDWLSEQKEPLSRPRRFVGWSRWRLRAPRRAARAAADHAVTTDDRPAPR